MLRNYAIISFRHLLKHKVFSLINVCGLALGMSASFLIVHYVGYEMSFDTFHKNTDRIYRVCHNRYQDGVLQYEKAQSFIPTGEALQNDFPEVQDYTTLFKISDQAEIIVSYRNPDGETISYNEENVYHVKGNIFHIFSIPIKVGTSVSGSIEPKTVFISSAASKKYFGDASPLNKVIHHTYNGDYTIAGVFEDTPENSHLKPDFLFSWESITDEVQGGDAANWHWDGFYTYILLSPHANASSITSKFEQFTEKYLGSAEDRIGESEFWLQPLTDIHLRSHLLGEAGANGNGTIVKMLKGLAFFILIMAYINYINLSSAKASERAKEVGVRKIVGSGRVELIRQFLLESFIVNVMAAMLAAAIVSLLILQFGESLGLPRSFDLLQRKEFWIAVTGLLIAGSFGSGIYPAFIISSFAPIRALKDKITVLRTDATISLRRAMVTFQLVLSIVLITGAAMVYKQIKHMNDQDLGINIDQTLVLRTFAKFGPPGSDLRNDNRRSESPYSFAVRISSSV
jgi:putative ABC transport system permease protein